VGNNNPKANRKKKESSVETQVGRDGDRCYGSEKKGLKGGGNKYSRSLSHWGCRLSELGGGGDFAFHYESERRVGLYWGGGKKLQRRDWGGTPEGVAFLGRSGRGGLDTGGGKLSRR